MDYLLSKEKVKRWPKDMIAAGRCHTVGLKSDGTVVAVGRNKEGECNASGWRDIEAVAVGNDKHNQCDVSGWINIVAIAVGTNHTIGLKSDGTVVAVGNNEFGQCDVGSWRDIRLPGK
ncbi:hypothetical protein [Bacillus cereus group sp. BfR-BA-01353]|uniref:hypothetical protein n=1 Tax=Bacillus cereus group sp. BfR-BA-01353 TaxID=2920316 RepID=UPI0027BA3078|nr:hypothetical protein [Bacillus cereus group sp. BfR-BA-01353]